MILQVLLEISSFFSVLLGIHFILYFSILQNFIWQKFLVGLFYLFWLFIMYYTVLLYYVLLFWFI